MSSKKKGEQRWIKPSQQPGTTMKNNSGKTGIRTMQYIPKKNALIEANKKKMQEAGKKYIEMIRQGNKKSMLQKAK